MTISRLMLGMVSLVVIVASFGCGRSPDASFYTLSALAPQSASFTANTLSISVGPVALPDLVDRPQLVMRIGDNRVELLENHLWAEPLKSEIPRLMAENLSRLLRPANVSVYGQYTVQNAQYHVLMDIRRFDSMPGVGVTIEALWSIRRDNDKTVFKTGRSLVSQPVEKAGYDAVAAAYSRALMVICGDIAKALRGR